MNLDRLCFWLQHEGYTLCALTELEEFMAGLKNEKTGQPLKNVTSNTILRDLTTFWNWMVKRRHVSHCVPSLIQKRKENSEQVPPYTKEELDAIFEYAANTNCGPRDRAFIYFVFDTGIRASELLRLQMKDIDLERKVVHILGGKGDKNRTVYFSDEAQGAFYDYLDGRVDFDDPNATDFVFVAESGPNVGNPLTRSGVYQISSRICKAAGIKGKKGPHRLRHSFTYYFLRDGGQQQAAMLMLGHEDARMVHKYNKIAAADCQREHSEHSPLARLRSSEITRRKKRRKKPSR